MIFYARSTARILLSCTLAHRCCCGQAQPFAAFLYRTSRIVLGIPMWSTSGVFYGNRGVCSENEEWHTEATTVRRWKRQHGVPDLAERLGVDTSLHQIGPPVRDRSVRGGFAAPPESSDGEILREAVRIALGLVSPQRGYPVHPPAARRDTRA